MTVTPTPNRVLASVELVRAKFENTGSDAERQADASSDIDASMHFMFQEAQAAAHASGRLTLEEALVVYESLGEFWTESNGGWTKGTDTPTKVVVTILMAELLLK